MTDKRIIAGFVGIGKSTLAKKYPNEIIDLESSKYKWIYIDEKLAKLDIEKQKGSKLGRIINPNYPQNYIVAIKNALLFYNLVIISNQSFTAKMAEELLPLNIPILNVFPDSLELTKGEWISRVIARGNTKAFIENLNENWNSELEKMTEWESISTMYELPKEKYLEDLLIELNLITKGYD